MKSSAKSGGICFGGNGILRLEALSKTSPANPSFESPNSLIRNRRSGLYLSQIHGFADILLGIHKDRRGL